MKITFSSPGTLRRRWSQAVPPESSEPCRAQSLSVTLFAMIFREQALEFCNVLLKGLAVVFLIGHTASLFAAGPDSVHGTLTIAVEDYFTQHRAKTRYFVEDRASGNVELVFASEPGDLRTGTVVTATGRRHGMSLEGADVARIDSSHSGRSIPQASGSASTASLPAITPSSGNQTTLIYNLISATGSATPTYSNSQLNDSMFASSGRSVDLFYRRNSFNTVSFSGTVTGPYPVTVPATCDTNGIANQADKLATAAGVNIAQYAHHVYMLPAEMLYLCNFAGSSTLGRNPSQEWINSVGVAARRDVVGIFVVLEHELGHGLDMQHSQAISIDGSLIEYGDNSCVMGDDGYHLVDFNFLHLIQEGWIPVSNILQVNAPGTYSVAFAEQQTNGTQALQIALPGTTGNLYVSYLQPNSSEVANFPEPFLSGASIHYWNGGSAKIQLATNYPWGGALSDGQTYISTDGLVSIKQISHNSASVVVQVDALTPTAPVPSLVTVNSASGAGVVAPGSLASMYLTVPTLPTMSASTVPYPQTLGGVEVRVNGIQSSLLYVSPTQINFQLPATVQTPNLPLVGGADISVYFHGQLIAERRNSGVAKRSIGVYTVPNPSDPAYQDWGLLNAVVTYYKDGEPSAAHPTVVPSTQVPGTFVLNKISLDPSLGVPYLSIYATGVNGIGGVPSVNFENLAVTPSYSGPQGVYPGLDQINVSLAGVSPSPIPVHILFPGFLGPEDGQEVLIQFVWP